MPEHAAASRLWFSGLCFLLQILLILLFAVLVRYSPEGSPGPCPPQLNCSQRSQDPNFLPCAQPWQCQLQSHTLPLLPSMVSADFCTAAVLISTGAVLGRVSPVQMLLLTEEHSWCPGFLYHPNSCTFHVFHIPQVSDSGGSLTVHTFGAYFGLMVSRVLYQSHKDKRKREEQQDKGHHKDVFAVVGTIYLWIFWPSFTSTTTVHHDGENWAVLNSYFSLVASTPHAGAFHGVHSPDCVLFHQVQLQDATLAAMAVMGMAGEMLLTPFGALIAGFLVGLITPLGFRFFTPVLHSKLKIQDTCGVHNTHGLPGVLGALLGTLLTLLGAQPVLTPLLPPFGCQTPLVPQFPPWGTSAPSLCKAGLTSGSQGPGEM
uniref:Rh family B glycoprotein (gene/pseudogene) n=1 Tax=Junco hyemalis TaxID=40217 RepID=A0A8C5J8E2_JUNHY